jgi:DNA-binding MarR family transcriptional regulator
MIRYPHRVPHANPNTSAIVQAVPALPLPDLADAVLTVASLARGLERGLDDMTLAQYRILTMIGSSPQRAGHLAERAALSKSTLTGVLDGLTARGWVLRTEIEGDRRGVGLELTDAGSQARIRAERALVQRLQHVLDFVDVEERPAAVAGLDVCRRALHAAWQAKR